MRRNVFRIRGENRSMWFPVDLASPENDVSSWKHRPFGATWNFEVKRARTLESRAKGAIIGLNSKNMHTAVFTASNEHQVIVSSFQLNGLHP